MISKQEIIHIAKLARLELSEKEIESYSDQLSKALQYFDQIAAVETKGIEPMITPSPIEQMWRDDIVQKELSAEEILSNAPQKTGNLFTVPPVV